MTEEELDRLASDMKTSKRLLRKLAHVVKGESTWTEADQRSLDELARTSEPGAT